MSLSTEEGNQPACDFDRNIALLRDIPFFSGLPLDSVKTLAYVCRTLKFRDGESIFEQGVDDSNAYFILSGRAELLRDGEVVDSLSEGKFIGAMALMTDVRRLFALRAVGQTEVIVIPRKKFLTDMQAKPDTAAGFFKALAAALVHWESSRLANESQTWVGVSLL